MSMVQADPSGSHMTGPEHYVEAERLIALAEHQYGGSRDDDTHPQWTSTIQRAQVHATLALVAATAASTQSSLFTVAPEWRGLIR